MKPTYINAALVIAQNVAASPSTLQEVLSEGTDSDLVHRPDGNPFTEDFNRYANRILEEWKVPGMSIAVVDGQDIFAKGFGFAELPDTPVEPETMFYIGSLTKAFTAATLSLLMDNQSMTLLSDGWRTPISSIIRDDFVLQDEWATLHLNLDDAASHRSGFFGHDGSWHHWRDGKPTTVKEVVRNMRHLPISMQPRLEYHYSNFMYVTLSHVVEVVTGRGLGDVMKELIWAPLGMAATYLNLNDALSAREKLAASYSWQETNREYLEMPHFPTEEVSGAGATISNVLDYARWIRCLLHETEPLSKRVHADVKAPRFIASYDDDAVTHYTIGWNRGVAYDETSFRHQGSTYFHGSNAFWLPHCKFGIITLANGAGSSNSAGSVLVQRLIEGRLGMPNDESVELNKRLKEQAKEGKREVEKAIDCLYPNRPAVAVPPSVEIAQLTGRYYHPGYGTVELYQQSHQIENMTDWTLEADRTDLLWQQKWRLRHVSSSYWILYATRLADPGDVAEYSTAKFQLGIAGSVSSLEINFAIDCSKTYDKVLHDTIIFDKVG